MKVEEAIKLAKYLGIAETKKEVERLAGNFSECFKFVDINDFLQGDTQTFCQEMFAQMLSDDFVKNDFPIRYFPNPEIYRFIKKLIRNNNKVLTMVLSKINFLPFMIRMFIYANEREVNQMEYR